MDKESYGAVIEKESKKEENAHKKWAKGKKPSMKRRSEFNDYLERGIYMITMAIEERRPLLGTLKGNYIVTEGEDRPHVELSPLGNQVKACWMKIPHFHPEITVIKLCIMPDHIHGVLFVRERMEQHLGQVIAGFKTGTRKAARELGVINAALIAQPTEQDNTATQETATQETTTQRTATQRTATQETTTQRTATQETTTQKTATQKTTTQKTATQETATQGTATQKTTVPQTVSYVALPAQLTHVAPQPSQPTTPQPSRHTAVGRSHGLLWEPNYHDRILLHEGQLKRMLDYLEDNPRRLLLKRAFPQFFSKITRVTAAGMEMEAMGNTELLQRPFKLQVQCSRHLYSNEIEQRKAWFLEQGRKGAVIVSPCISPGEAEISKTCLAAKVPLIVLLLKGFPPFFKPHPRYLEACASGRLLLLAPYPFQNEKIEHMRSRCLSLNDIAARICQTT